MGDCPPRTHAGDSSRARTSRLTRILITSCSAALRCGLFFVRVGWRGCTQNPHSMSANDLYGIDQFTYRPEENSYLCPEGKVLKYVGINARNRTHLYYSTVKRCRECSQKNRCTRGKYRTIAIHTCEPARQHARPGPDTSVRHLATGSSKSGSTLRRAEELHRTTPTEAAPDALRARAVLPGGNGAEPETAGAIPQL
jgi:hypothetical protein